MKISIGSEKCWQRESTGIVVVKGMVVTQHQEGPFERVVVLVDSCFMILVLYLPLTLANGFLIRFVPSV